MTHIRADRLVLRCPRTALPPQHGQERGIECGAVHERRRVGRVGVGDGLVADGNVGQYEEVLHVGR